MNNQNRSVCGNKKVPFARPIEATFICSRTRNNLTHPLIFEGQTLQFFVYIFLDNGAGYLCAD